MDIFEVIKKRRSIRKFDKSRNISEETLNQILEAGLWAPSAGNVEPYRFYVVTNDDVKDKLAKAAFNQMFIKDAPVLVVVTIDINLARYAYGTRGVNLYAIQDTAASIQNMLLAATAKGIGSLWVGAFDEEKVKKELDLSNERPVAIVAFGYALETPLPPERKSLEEVVEYIF